MQAARDRRTITYRIAVGPQQGRKVFTLQTLPDERDAYETPGTTAGNVAVFSLHAGVAAKANQRAKLERLCRYITRPAVSEKRLSLTNQGKVRYELKTPAQRHVAMTWAQRLKRVFDIDVETCRICGGAAKVIACIEDPVVIQKILAHLEEKAPTRAAFLLPDSRAPPQSSLFG